MQGESPITLAADPGGRRLRLTWPDGSEHVFHYVWLRHHARCPRGMSNDTRVKIDLLPDDPATLAVRDCYVDADRLVVNWSDHDLQTRHDLEDLRRCAYDDETRLARKHRPRTWDREGGRALPVLDAEGLKSPAGRLQLLLAVMDFGLARVTGVERIRDVAACFGPIHVNNYGEIFDVRSDASLNLGSNTGDYLPPHTDESYRHEAPGISLFHCLESAPAGGESILVDGFEAARVLACEYPDSYQVLCSTPIYFRRYAPPLEDMRSHARMLVTDIDGDLVGLRWTDRTLPPQDVPASLVEPVYLAIRRLRRIINDDSLQLRYRMAPGDLHVFDNHRVLHGREAFDPAAGNRHLRQCSVNRDEFHSSLRRLAAELGHPAAELVMSGGALG